MDITLHFFWRRLYDFLYLSWVSLYSPLYVTSGYQDARVKLCTWLNDACAYRRDTWSQSLLEAPQSQKKLLSNIRGNTSKSSTLLTPLPSFFAKPPPPSISPATSASITPPPFTSWSPSRVHTLRLIHHTPTRLKLSTVRYNHWFRLPSTRLAMAEFDIAAMVSDALGYVMSLYEQLTGISLTRLLQGFGKPPRGSSLDMRAHRVYFSWSYNRPWSAHVCYSQRAHVIFLYRWRTNKPGVAIWESLQTAFQMSTLRGKLLYTA